MKYFKILFAVLVIPIFLTAQKHKQFTKDDLKKIVGKWNGTVTLSKKVNDSFAVKMPISVDITDAGDSLIVNTSTTINGKVVTEKYGMFIDDEVTELTFENRLNDIKQIIRSPVKLIVKVLDPNEKAMIDDEYAEIRTTFTIGDKIFFINQEVKYFQTELFFVRKKIELYRQ